MLISRNSYLNALLENKDVDLVKIITGIRRCGKSSLLELFKNHLKKENKQIIHINFESFQYAHLLDTKSLYAYIEKNINKNKRAYLLFDELQEVESWEKVIESLRLDFDVDIYITGSNAQFLSSEFATFLSGRYIEIKMLPLSFKEFLDFYSFSSDLSLDDKFQKYLIFGGMPILKDYNFNKIRSMEALEAIYSTVVLKDILSRNAEISHHTLEKIIKFLCANIGSITSPNNIANSLHNEKSLTKANLARQTVEKYINLLENPFIFYKVNRYDIKGKQFLKTLQKHYLVDIGFRNMLLGFRDVDLGYVLENIVFLELIRRNYKVYIGKINDLEVDFIAENQESRIYVQVSLTLTNKDTLDRELKPLQSIRDNYEKMVITMDKSLVTSIEGIKIKNVIEWLMEE